MGKKTIRPEIIVKNNYTGNQDMKELFIKMFVLQAKREICSSRTFDNLKDTEYNLEKNKIKGAT